MNTQRYSGSCRRLICLSLGFVLLAGFFSSYKGSETQTTVEMDRGRDRVEDLLNPTQPLLQNSLQQPKAVECVDDQSKKVNATIPTQNQAPFVYKSVSSFKDPSSWCRTNPFLASWSSSKFTEAALSVIEYRSSIVLRTHEKTWNAHLPISSGGGVTHKPYDSLPSVVPCTDAVYSDADSKVICGLSRLQAPCIIYSLGSNGNFAFEEAVSKMTQCEIHTFDCTVSKERMPATLPARVTYHSICLGSDEEVTSQYRSLGSLMREFGHNQVDLLKMDIEGFEFRVVEAMYGSFLKEGGKNLPLQIAFEQHFLTSGSSQPAWSNKVPGLSAGDMAVLWIDLTDMGYVLAGRKDNPDCPYCTELSAIRVFCEN